jgi:hypothetical protein
MQISFGDCELLVEEETGATQVSVGSVPLLARLEPVLFYDGDWVTCQFQGAAVHHGWFEERADLGECARVTKEYRALQEPEVRVWLDVCVFAEVRLVFVQARIEGNSPKSDTLAGFIDLGVPRGVDRYRVFHSGGPLSTDNRPGSGLELFSPTQSAWQEPVLLGDLPDSAEFSLCYAIARHQSGVVGFIPVNRAGQRTLIRTCGILDAAPPGLKFVSGNYLPAQQFSSIAGGIIAWGENPLELSDRGFTWSMRLLRRTHALRINKAFPPAFESLGFCTWNTFYASVSMDFISDLASENFRPECGSDRFRYFIVDDGWQSINGDTHAADAEDGQTSAGRCLRDFRANRKFPHDIGQVATLLRNEYGFQHVGIWHAVAGYWEGVERNSRVGRQYPLLRSGNASFASVRALEGQAFWTHYYRHLAANGIDLLKIDNQCAVGQLVAGHLPIDEGIENFYLMQQGAAYSQNIEILNCMCMGVDNKIHWTKSNVARVSDDFYPCQLERHKHQIKQCAFNPLFYAPFCWPDTDMFYTGGPDWHKLGIMEGTNHPLVLVHAVSGGPIYVSDEVGETRGEVVNTLCFEDGRLARLSAPAQCTLDCLFEDTEENYATKMWSYHEVPGYDRVHYLFAGNMTRAAAELEVTTRLADLGISEGRFIAQNRDTGQYWSLDPDQGFIESIANLRASYYVISPLKNGVALLGCREVYNGTCALERAEWVDGTHLVLSVKYAGTLELYALQPQEVTVVDATGEELPMAGKGRVLSLPVDAGVYVVQVH